MPLWPLLRVPALLSVCVVVFCMAFVAESARANHASAFSGASNVDCVNKTGHDAASGTTADYQLTLWRLQAYNDCQGYKYDLRSITGTVTPPGSGKSLSNLDTRLQTISGDTAQLFNIRDRWNWYLDAFCDDSLCDNTAGGDSHSYLQQIESEVDGLQGYTDGIEGKLDTLHSDLVALKTSVDAQGNNATCADGNPCRVKLASSETQLDEAANAGLGALWFLAGLLCVVVVAGSVRKAIFPR